MMRIIDISWPINSEMTAYKDRRIVRFEQTKTFEQDKVREALVHIGTHSGTHIDAPAHFIKNGRTIDQLIFTACCGRAQVVDVSDVDDYIKDTDLQQHDIDEGSIVLLKTRNSQLSPTDNFEPSFVYCSAGAAEYLVSKRVKAVGIDYLGIERGDPAHPTHTAFMQQNIPIIEGLRLQAVNAGSYQLWCLPLKVVGLEAAPARAILVAD